MSSEALNDLSDRLDEVRRLTAVDPARDPKLTSDPKLSGAICRACVVLLSAHLEGYVEDVATEALDALVSGGARVDRLPDLLRAIHTEEHLRALEPIKDRNARTPRIARIFLDEGPLWNSGNTLAASMIRAKTLCAEMDNPGSKEIRRFLELLGVQIEAFLSQTGSPRPLGQIDGLISRRNAIAHGEVTVSATPADVDFYLDIVEGLAREIDVAVAQSVRSVCGSSQMPW